MTTFDVLHGDCLAVMPTLDAESVDAIVSDPPYGLGFMGKQWDHGVPGVDFWREALRVAKPGAHLVAFGGTRTYHRLACAIEDAGWEIRDCLSWLYGSGFPKSHDVSKAIDKAAGAEREVVGERILSNDIRGNSSNGKGISGPRKNKEPFVQVITAAATDLARQWHGWGTALKPAWEPIILARKPLAGTVAANVAQYGTGGINVDGCRIEGKLDGDPNRFAKTNGGEFVAFSKSAPVVRSEGRWPANVCLDDEAAELLDAQSGERKSSFHSGPRGTRPRGMGETGEHGGDPMPNGPTYGDCGGASRFFYTAKASRREREAGLERMPKKRAAMLNAMGDNPPESIDPVSERFTTSPAANVHPTVKPIALMRWLCRLVTPPGGRILDPFTGSGSTGCAAVLEGFRFVGIEREAEYVEIAEKRIAHWHSERDLPDLFG
jgi:DNA modification methylase